MRFAQNKAPPKNSKYIDIKEIEYFKQIFKLNNDLFLKELIPLVISTAFTKTLNHHLFIYIPQYTIDDCLSHKVIDPSIKELSKKASLIKITKHLDLILREIFSLNIPVLSNFKTQDRFFLLNQCETKSFPFNRILLKKGDPIEGIYYIVKGQVRLTFEKGEKKEKVLSYGNFLCLEDLVTGQTKSTSTIISNQNLCLTLFISMDILKRGLEEEEVNLKDLFIEYYRKNVLQNNNFRLSKLNLSKTTKNWKPTKIQIMKFNDFIKKSKEFKECTSQRDDNFNKYVETKKIILKLYQTVKSNQGEKKENKIDKMLNSLRNNKEKKQKKERCTLFRDILLKRLNKTLRNNQTQN